MEEMERLRAEVAELRTYVRNQAANADAVAILIGMLLGANPDRQKIAEAARRIATLNRYRVLDVGFDQNSEPDEIRLYTEQVETALNALLAIGQAG